MLERGEVIMMLLAWIIPLVMICVWGLGIYALVLLIKALRIYIDKNS
ncbi:hypothetical protein CBU02nite_28860 [Clostridium butyricum]|jgi:hypothetical protein|uniref:Uncharacterized protein n=1 Tax=Clostridium butyricum TaxID=1492 RepID=A0A512TQ30_CLOBU|nr:hypothetical protein CBU02nite_28860 [Clostridium butyricum]